jgi:hypothetical protein
MSALKFNESLEAEKDVISDTVKVLAFCYLLVSSNNTFFKSAFQSDNYTERFHNQIIVYFSCPHETSIHFLFQLSVPKDEPDISYDRIDR